jgi:peptide/nickel transport system ATP-binding protein
MSESLLLRVQNLAISAEDTILVSDLSFQLNVGQTLAIVGESGSGKTLSSLSLMGLLPNGLSQKGVLHFKGNRLDQLTETSWSALRGKEISMIFQEPMSALNPSMKCGRQVAEVLETHGNSQNLKEQVIALFNKVELPRVEAMYDSYPHQLSGGQKQRVVIAMAIANNPALLIADEPTTALDVSVQNSILKLLKKLQVEFGMGMIFISHDLGVVKQVADEVLVLYHGEMKERGSVQYVFNESKDPYTRGLIACRPSSDTYFKRLPLVQDFLVGDPLKEETIDWQTKEERAHAITKQEPILKIKSLSKVYRSKQGILGKALEVKALTDFDLKVYPGESLGLVGESGSGKSTIGRILVGLEKAEVGQIFYEGQDIRSLNKKAWRSINKDIQIIFQDPFGSLNPRMPVGEAIAEVLRVNGHKSKSEAKKEVDLLLEKVGLLKEYGGRYPHEFSGGQRQRIGIARALALEPKFLICDESVSALDVSVQAQILNLLNDLKDEFGFTYLFISHDLQVVRYFCDRVVVLRDGRLVEKGFAETLFRDPKEEYTKSLIHSTEP